MLVAATPVAADPVVYIGEGEARHIDVEQTIRMMAINIGQMKQAAAPGALPDESAISQYEKKINRASKWGGWVWGALSILGFIFTAGVTWSVFMGANATDSEVEAADKAAIIEHNGGVDPEAIDVSTHKPIGEHPDMQKAIQSNREAVRKIDEEVLPPMIKTQKKLDKRSEYQFELGRWQSDVMEADRAKKKAPPKPDRVRDLESDLALGKY